MRQRNIFVTAFINWLPLGVAILALGGLVYTAMQQNYRMNANDPQVQMAEDIATEISKSPSLPENIPNPTQDMTLTLGSYWAIYDATGTPVGASMSLDGKLPVLPKSALEASKKTGENRITWQPKKGARFATVIKPFKTQGGEGFVVVGRSLREVEKRIKMLGITTAAVTLLSLILTYLLSLLSANRTAAPEVIETVEAVVVEEIKE